MAKPVITSATPGATRLTADTLALAEGYVEVRSIGPIPVKGFAQLVEAYELTGAGTARTLRVLFAAHPELLTPLLRIAHRVIAGFLLKQAGLKRGAADTGAVTLIQRFGSAANLSIHLHCLVLDGVYRRTEGEALFQEARAPTGDEAEGLLDTLIARVMKSLARLGHLVEEQGMT